MNRDFYAKLISDIEEAIKAGDYQLADRLISAELAMPYVPSEVLAILQKHKHEIAPNLRIQKPVTLLEPEQLIPMLERGGEEAAGALRSLQKANIRNYLSEINECLSSRRIDHLIKVLLSEMLVEQKVDETFEFLKENETLRINPAEMVTVSKQPQLLKVMEALEKLLAKNPSFLSQAQTLALNLACDHYPAYLEAEKLDVYVYSIIRYLYHCYGEDEQWQMFASAQGVNEDGLIDLHY